MTGILGFLSTPAMLTSGASFMPPLFFAGEDLLRAGAFCLTYFTNFALVRPGWGFCLFAFVGFCLCCFDGLVHQADCSFLP